MKIYVGHDSREDIAYQVCEHSIKRRDPSAEVIPLKQRQMREQGLYTRPVDKLASTEFTFTRFFIPYLNDFKGWAVFCDCDFVWRIPSHELIKFCDPSKAIQLRCIRKFWEKGSYDITAFMFIVPLDYWLDDCINRENKL